MAQLRVTVASYNIHIGIGRDGQFAPQRTASVLQELHADIIALQEVQLGSPGFNMFDYLRTGTGLHGVARPTLVHPIDRKSTRLNSSHLGISYAVFCLKKKKNSGAHSRAHLDLVGGAPA